MRNIEQVLKQRRESTYRKLKFRFIKGLKTGVFQNKTKKQKRHLIEKLKQLELRLGLKSNPKLKHWAMALALGFITVASSAQDGRKSKEEKLHLKKDVKENTTRRSSGSKFRSGATVSLFEPQDFLGDPLIGDGVRHFGDFDGDGDQDLLVASYYGPLRILPNDGTGHFGAPINIAQTMDPSKLLVADLDGDGDLDILIGDSYGIADGSSTNTRIYLLANNGDNTFTESSQLFQGVQLDDDIELQDIDGDGDMDLLAGTYLTGNGNAVSILSNDGTGLFTITEDLLGSSRFVTGDFDNDGDVDIAVENYYLKIFNNEGGVFANETYTISESVPFNFNEARSGDFNGDENLDIVFDDFNGVSMISLGATEHILSNTNLDGIYQRYYLSEVIDIDGDGDLDLLIESDYENRNDYTYHQSHLLLTNTSGSFTQSSLGNIQPNIGEAEALLGLDVDGDLDMDLVVSNYFDIVVFANDGNQNFSLLDEDLVEVVYGFESEMVDIDNDDDLDIIISGTTMIIENDGSGNLSIKQNIARESNFISYAMATGDFDGDGDIDVVFSNSYADELVLWTNDGTGSFTQASTLETAPYPDLEQAIAIDIDIDGDMDLVTSTWYNNGYLLITFNNDGAGNFTIDQTLNVSYEIDDVLLAADLDSDGDMDIISGGYSGVIIFVNEAGTIASPTVYLADAGGFDNLGLADLDGDGDTDIIALNDYISSGQYHYILSNNGDATFESSILDIASSNYAGVLIQDFDLDGDLDLYLGGGEDYEDEIWAGDGSGGFTLLGTVGTRSYHPVAGDIDNDGDMDIFSLEYYVGNRLILNTTNTPTTSNTITTSDSLALVAIFDQLDGDNWIQKVGWKVEKASEWFGVTLNLDNKRVIELALSSNELTGEIPEELALLTELTSLSLEGNNLTGTASPLDQLVNAEHIDVSGNQLSGFPDLSGITPLTTLKLENNHLTFGSIVPNAPISSFTYSPQANLGMATTDTIPGGSSYTLDWGDLGVGTQYQWSMSTYTFDTPINETPIPIEGATSQSYNIAGMSIGDQGFYELKATHPDAPLLTLTSERITLYGEADLTGMVSGKAQVDLFRVLEGPYFLAATTTTNETGGYAFTGLILGEFMVLAHPDLAQSPGSTHTYYGNTHNWSAADTIFLNQTSSNLDITLLDAPAPPQISEGVSVAGNVAVSGIDVDLENLAINLSKSINSVSEPYIYISTDAAGHFDFGLLDVGSYQLDVQYPGIPMEESSSMGFEIAETDIGGIWELFATMSATGISVNIVKSGATNTIVESDSLILVDFYNNLDGDNWNNKTNWLTGNADIWHGVKIDETKRVSELSLPTNGLAGSLIESLGNLAGLKILDLSVNELQGSVPATLSGLTSLENVNVSSNDLRSFPDLSGTSLTSLNLSGNRLTFADIVPNTFVANFTYTPQKRFGETVYDTIPAGETRVVSIQDLGEGTLYQWNFGPLIPGQPYNNNVSPITGATNPVYEIENINASKQGTYRITATHPQAPSLTISSRNVNIMAKTNLFGTVYADDNNTLLTDGDVIIYRLKDGPFIPEDTAQVDASGKFSFTDLVLGDFIILTQPNRAIFPSTIQTYYKQAESYEDATVLEVRERMEGVDIQMVFYVEPPVEIGASISGELQSDLNETEIGDEEARVNARRKVKKAGCSMRRFVRAGRTDQDGEYILYAYVESDDEGRFNFSGIEPGTYRLNIEYPGVPMDPSAEIEFIIRDDGSSQKFEVFALITEDGIFVESTEVLGAPLPYLRNVKIYPNPSDHQLTAEYLVNQSVNQLRLALISMSGATLLSQELEDELGAHKLSLDLSHLEAGTYFLILHDSSGEFRYQFKISKR